MSIIERLQQVGLNKYEAEAYYALLTHKPLTGYEVGKYSQVPASRSYEVLERLVEKGLALVQPGDPPRFTAQDPQQFLARIQAEMEGTLGGLTAVLLTLPRMSNEQDFWVVRGRQHILARLQVLVDEAHQTLNLSLSPQAEAYVAEALERARVRNCQVYLRPLAGLFAHAESLIVLRDDQEALVGTLAPADSCQAMVSKNMGMLGTLHGYFATLRDLQPLVAAIPAPEADTAWIDWETRKQQHLWKLSTRQRTAS